MVEQALHVTGGLVDINSREQEVLECEEFASIMWVEENFGVTCRRTGRFIDTAMTTLKLSAYR